MGWEGGLFDSQLTSWIDFWGPVSNFGIPVAAVMDTQKSPDLYVHPLFARHRERACP